jgi:hydroxymethylpyrimidine/phosphomethylpyrimidine kinase
VEKETQTAPYVVTLSGSDASGNAGLQADNRAIHAMGGFPLNVVTALTLQTESGVQSIDTTAPELIRMHLFGLLNSHPVKVIKAGMLGNAEIVGVVVEALRQYPSIKLVLDPVLQATSGRPLLDEGGINAMLTDLLPMTYLLTPNLPELARLTGLAEPFSNEMEQMAAEQLLQCNCKAVLVKGGHRTGDLATDRLYQTSGVSDYRVPRIETTNTRGSGCALASLIAACLAKGKSLEEAVSDSKAVLSASMRRPAGIGNGTAFL